MGDTTKGSAFEKFLNGLTVQETVTLITILMLGFASVYLAINDTQPNKAAIELAHEKTTQTKYIEETNKVKAERGMPVSRANASDDFSNGGFQTVSQPICSPPHDYNLGNYVLASGACTTFDNSNGEIKKEYFVIGTASPVISIEGSSNFIVTVADATRSSCRASETSDRCGSWIRNHQQLGIEDVERRIKRYWFYFILPSGSGQKIIINTAR